MSLPADLNPEAITGGLNALRIGKPVRVCETVASTNDAVRDGFDAGDTEGLVVIADAQSSGRGRLGRSWLSTRGVGVYLSLLLTPGIDKEHLPQLTLMAGVAVAEALRDSGAPSPLLKWPNDVLCGGKKLCGILCEYHQCKNGGEGVILGIGVNVNHAPEDFTHDLRSTATSLLIETGRRHDRGRVIRTLLARLDQEYDDYLMGRQPGLAEKWSRHTDLFGKSITLTQGGRVTEGTAVRLDPSGRLVVRTLDGKETAFDSGEVTLTPPA